MLLKGSREYSNCNSNIIILLILLIEYVAVTPLPEHRNRSAFCPAITTCSCFFETPDYRIQCPPFGDRISVRIQPNKYVHIECSTVDETNYSLVPKLLVDDITTFQMRKCPLPRGKSIRAISDQVGMKEVRTLSFQNYPVDIDNSFAREHLKGFDHLERLVLNDNNLSSLPEDLFVDVGSLTRLDLRSNRLILPRDIFLNLTNLEHLELGSNNLENLEEGIFRKQKRLTHLNLWGNSLQNLTGQVFDGVSSIISLDLSSNKMETLKNDIFSQLKNLSNLNLSANRFKMLPEGVFTYNKELKHFRLLENRVPLETLPSRFLSNLTKLQEVRIKCGLIRVPGDLFKDSINILNISLSRNEIRTLPPDLFADQIKLIDLDLSRNNLSQLNEKLFANTSSLITLTLSYNELTDISSDVFNRLPNLKNIYMNNNKLHRINSEAFLTTTSLEVIYLENNRLSDFNFEYNSPFEHLDGLKILNLRNNLITKIFNDWNLKNIQLRELDLSYNNISKLSYSDLQFLSKKITVNLTNNSITVIDFLNINIIDFGGKGQEINSDVEILLGNNPILCNCVLLNFVKFLRNEVGKEIKKFLRIESDDLRCSSSSPNNLMGQLVQDVHPMKLLCPLDSEKSTIKSCPNECACWVRLEDKAVIVNCSNIGLTKVPRLPSAKNVSLDFIELHLENNNLRELPKVNNYGYVDVKEIYAYNNNITKLTPANIPPALKILELSNNHLEWVNGSVLRMLNTTQFKKITLGGSNRWKCDCNAVGLFDFVQTNLGKISDYNTMNCTTDKGLLAHSRADLCPENEIVIAGSILISLLSLILGVFAALYYKYQQEVKVWLFARGWCLWFVTEEELDKEKKYDAFISYSHKDEDYIVEHLVPQLENGPTKFTLCLHMRDFIPGAYISDQIVQAVEDSRRTIVVLSPNFLNSVWGAMEFRAAHAAALREGRARVIIIIYGDVGETDKLDSELRAYLNMNTYVKWNDPWFWDKLRYAMPHPPNYRRKKGTIKSSIKNLEDDKTELTDPSNFVQLTTPPAEQVTKNPLTAKLNGEVHRNGLLPNGLTAYMNGGFIINPNTKENI